MKNSFKTLLGGALFLTLPMFLTSCEDILGEWDKPTPVTPEGDKPTVEDAIKYGFKVKDLQDVDKTEAVTSLKMSNTDGGLVATAEVSDGKITIKAEDLAAVTTAADFWFEATIGGKPYIAKVNIDPATLSPESDKTLAMATLGDLINSDGTFSAAAEAGKTPVGAIAYLGNDATTETIGDGGGHGLVLCLKNAAQGADAQWSTENTAFEFAEDAKVDDVNDLKRTTNVSGYTNTETLATKVGAVDKYKAAYKAKYYTGLTAPAGTTGWFLPSAQQWVKMQEALGGIDGSTDDLTIKLGYWFDNNHTGVDKWEAAIKKAGEGNYDSMSANYYFYQSSSENDASNAILLGVDAMATGDVYGFELTLYPKTTENDDFRVRPVLAF